MFDTTHAACKGRHKIFYGVWGGYNSKEIEAQRRMRNIVLPPHYGYTRVRKRNNA